MECGLYWEKRGHIGTASTCQESCLTIPRNQSTFNMATTITGKEGNCTSSEPKKPKSIFPYHLKALNSSAPREVNSGAITAISTSLTVPPSSASPASSQINPDNSQPTLTVVPSDSLTPLTTSGSKNGTSSGNDGLEGRVVAGIAIGMLLAGVLLTGAILLFLLRRQKKRQLAHSPSSHLPPARYGPNPEKGPVMASRPVPSSIDSLLPQPASDDEIKDHVSKIRDNIKNHIRTYCHSAAMSTSINDADLRNVSSATGLSSSVLASALTNPSTRQDALRLMFAWVVQSKMTGGRGGSLLPSQLASLLLAMPSTTENSCK